MSFASSEASGYEGKWYELDNNFCRLVAAPFPDSSSQWGPLLEHNCCEGSKMPTFGLHIDQNDYLAL